MSNIPKREKVYPEQSRRVFVAMSGGVDSSVAALLLKEDGYDVVGAHMVCADSAYGQGRRGGIEHPDERSDIGAGVCRQAQDDRRDAMRVSAKLGIPFLTFDFRKEYREKVYEYMVHEYAAGRTPNPDVMCNREIKFGIFLKKALEAGADFIATGHYVRKEGEKLFEAKDKNKDQSYFLWTLTPEQLQRSLFPIGDYLKSEVREIARKAGLITADKKDSQGLCFVGKVDFQDFMRELLPVKEGLVKNSRGEILGKHDGAHFFTPGQRHGLNLGGFREPLYVADKDTITNTLVVAQGASDPVLYKKEIEVGNLNLLSELPDKVEVRIRYRQPKQKAKIYELKTKNYKLIFDVPQRGVAAGQSAVLYRGDELLGGGVIV